MNQLAFHISIALENIVLSNPLRDTLVDLGPDNDMSVDWRCVNYEDINTEIHRGFFSYVRLAYFLEKMRYYKMYKEQGLKSFQEYCLKVLRKSAHYCKKIISAANVCIELAAAGFDKLPSCVAQALPLVKFNTYDGGGNSPLAEKWQKVLDETPENAPITSTSITQILDETQQKTSLCPSKSSQKPTPNLRK